VQCGIELVIPHHVKLLGATVGAGHILISEYFCYFSMLNMYYNPVPRSEFKGLADNAGLF
jgi:hypothetical protein